MALDFVDERDDPRAPGRALEPALGVSQGVGHDLGGDLITQPDSRKRRDSLGPVHPLVGQRAAQSVGAGHGDQDSRLKRHHRLVIRRRL